MIIVKELIEALFLSPLIWIVLLVLGLVFWKRRWARKLLLVTILIVALAHSGAVARMMNYGLESRFAPLADIGKAGPYDAIVVLNGEVIPATGLIPYPSLGVSTFRRIEEAARLYHLRRTPIIMSGGPYSPAQDRNKIACNYLLSWGVAPADVIPEPYSADTYQSARAVGKILLEKGWRRYLLVTSAAHMPRSMLVFKRFAPEPIPAPGDFTAGKLTSPLGLLFGEGSADKISESVHEYVGLVVYRTRLWFVRR